MMMNNPMMNMNMMNMMNNNNMMMMNNQMMNQQMMNQQMMNQQMMNQQMMNQQMMNRQMMMNQQMGNNMGNATLNRLTKEFQLCQNDSELTQIGCSFGLINNDYFNWKVTMVGPKGTPYEGGIFTITIVFPPNYPKLGAEFKFQNRIYHLNVDWRETSKPDEKGHICLSTLNEWRSTGKVKAKKGFGVKQALFDIFCLFYNQGIHSPYDDNLAAQYRDNRKQFDEEAKKWTQMYAK